MHFCHSEFDVVVLVCCVTSDGKDTLKSDFRDQNIRTEMHLKKFDWNCISKLSQNVVWTHFSKITFHVVFLLSRLSKINLETIWICKKNWFGLAVWIRPELFSCKSANRQTATPAGLRIVNSSLCPGYWAYYCIITKHTHAYAHTHTHTHKRIYTHGLCVGFNTSLYETMIHPCYFKEAPFLWRLQHHSVSCVQPPLLYSWVRGLSRLKVRVYR